jgi:hypothetical protein
MISKCCKALVDIIIDYYAEGEYFHYRCHKCKCLLDEDELIKNKKEGDE